MSNERYTLEKEGKNRWKCTDTHFHFEITWREHHYNDTQQVNPLGAFRSYDVMEVARAMREIGQWLYDNHKDIVL